MSEAGSLRPEVVQCSLRELAVYFLRLGALGFGGPIALAGYMQRDLVEQRRWIAAQEYMEALALAQLSPGPLAAQLAMYLGWVRAGAGGAALIGAVFVLPSFVMVLALAIFYIGFGGLPWMQGLFYGVGRGRHRRPCEEHDEARATHARAGRASLGRLRHHSAGHGHHGVGDGLVVSGGRRSDDVRQGAPRWGKGAAAAALPAALLTGGHGAGTFIPPYLVVVLAARHVRTASQNPSLRAFVQGVTASATGAIAGAAFILGRRALVDGVTAGIALATLVALFKVKKVPEPVLIAMAGILGLVLERT